MTLDEKIVVSAYTGYLMCDFNEVHRYIENLLDRPVFTHELALGMIQDEIREKSKADFLKIYADKEVRLGLKKGQKNGRTEKMSVLRQERSLHWCV